MVGGLLALLTFEMGEYKHITNKHDTFTLKALIISQCIGVGLIIVFTWFFYFISANGPLHHIFV